VRKGDQGDQGEQGGIERSVEVALSGWGWGWGSCLCELDLPEWVSEGTRAEGFESFFDLRFGL